MRQLQSGKVQALVARHSIIDEPHLRSVPLIVLHDMSDSLEAYLAVASRAGPTAGKATILSLMSLGDAALAQPLSQVLQVSRLFRALAVQLRCACIERKWHAGVRPAGGCRAPPAGSRSPAGACSVGQQAAIAVGFAPASQCWRTASMHPCCC